MNEYVETSLTLPISEEVHRIAEKFSSQQPTPQKAEQVRNNTLSVLAVASFLQLMAIPTDLKAGDSWNPVMRLCSDVADLNVSNLGKLECRPVRREDTTCFVPPEVSDDRIGYVAVQLDSSHKKATLLGFTSEVSSDALILSQLQPIEDLLTHLHQLQEEIAAGIEKPQALASLSQWIRGQVADGWKLMGERLNPGTPELNWAFRGHTSLAGDPEAQVLQNRRVKVLEWDIPLALILEIVPDAENTFLIRLEIHSLSPQTYLPTDLIIQILDAVGEPFLTAQSRASDNYIQLQFIGQIEEKFNLRLSSGDSSFVEYFLI